MHSDLFHSILFNEKKKHGFGPNKWPPFAKNCWFFQPLGFITALCATPSWLHSTLALTDSKLSGLAITSINPTGLVVFVRGPLLCHRSLEAPTSQLPLFDHTAASDWWSCVPGFYRLSPPWAPNDAWRWAQEYSPVLGVTFSIQKAESPRGESRQAANHSTVFFSYLLLFSLN